MSSISQMSFDILRQLSFVIWSNLKFWFIFNCWWFSFLIYLPFWVICHLISFDKTLNIIKTIPPSLHSSFTQLLSDYILAEPNQIKLKTFNTIIQISHTYFNHVLPIYHPNLTHILHLFHIIIHYQYIIYILPISYTY